MNKVKMYQLENAATKYMFRGFQFAKDNGFSISDYKLVYSCERSDNYSLDKAFFEFNQAHPEGFNGHSLSVSDIVEVNGERYYCDNIGWEKIN